MRDRLRCCGGYRHPNDKWPSGLEAQGRDNAVGQISGLTTVGQAPTSGCAWATHASTQGARESTWRGFWPPDFANFLLHMSLFYGWLRSSGSTRMMALTARVSCCVFKVLGFNSNLFNFGPPSPGKLTQMDGLDQTWTRLMTVGSSVIGLVFFFFS